MHLCHQSKIYNYTLLSFSFTALDIPWKKNIDVVYAQRLRKNSKYDSFQFVSSNHTINGNQANKNEFLFLFSTIRLGKTSRP